MRSAAVLCALLALAVASVAAAVVVPQRSIAGVRLGMTKAQVRSTLGRPARTTRGTNEFGAFVVFRYPGLRVTFQGQRTVTDVFTTRRSERTARGIGVGSTVAQVRARVANVRCRTESGFRHCFVGRFLPGRRVTDFRIKAGRVTSVDVGFVID